jgi:hypothetical protein
MLPTGISNVMIVVGNGERCLVIQMQDTPKHTVPVTDERILKL